MYAHAHMSDGHEGVYGEWGRGWAATQAELIGRGWVLAPAELIGRGWVLAPAELIGRGWVLAPGVNWQGLGVGTSGVN